MIETTMDPVFSAAVKEKLIQGVRTERVAKTTPPKKWFIAAAVVGTIAVGGAGTALAISSITPGAAEQTVVGDPVRAEHTGPAVIEFGAPPAEATELTLIVSCATSSLTTIKASFGTPDSTWSGGAEDECGGDRGQIRLLLYVPL